MIMTVDELKRYVQTDEEDQALEARLQALELLIRAYTNNNFQIRAIRSGADTASDHQIMFSGNSPFAVGDTLHITESRLMNDWLVTVATVEGGRITVKETIYDEPGVVVTKVHYPQDVKMGVVNLLKWELTNRDKVGVASETISRHSVTYFDMGNDNSLMGFPKALMGFLKPYMKARFGRGVTV